jgi:hypothetical protein
VESRSEQSKRCRSSVQPENSDFGPVAVLPFIRDLAAVPGNCGTVYEHKPRLSGRFPVVVRRRSAPPTRSRRNRSPCPGLAPVDVDEQPAIP